jgi:Co/Zn/Cd efflux system component
MLSDVGALGASPWAMRLAARPARGAWTFGWKRAEIIASLIVVALMLKAAWGLLRDSGRVLLEAAPETSTSTNYAPISSKTTTCTTSTTSTSGR